MNKQHLIVIGGGAAGFFTAINAAINNPQLSITILEKSNKLLSKVKISGGGRCNVTHHCFDIVELSKKYPRGASFLKKCLHQFNTADTIAWFKTRGIALHTEADGRMFPSTNDSQTIIDCFLSEAKKFNITIEQQINVSAIQFENERFVLTTDKGNKGCDYLCIATGGAPKLSQYDWLINTASQQLKFVSPVPSLFTFNIPHHSITSLMGVAVPNAQVKIKGTKLQQTGPVLITHWGLSGPAVLKLSAYAALELAQLNYSYTAIINWLPLFNETSLLEHWKIEIAKTNQLIGNFNPFELPTRLWHFLLTASGIDIQAKWSSISKDKINLFVKNLAAYELQVSGKTTYKDEFVTAGGIDLSQIDHQTVSHKNNPNLFFAGEVLNIDGITGGFNFQNAWTTGFIAAKAIAQRMALGKVL